MLHPWTLFPFYVIDYSLLSHQPWPSDPSRNYKDNTRVPGCSKASYFTKRTGQRCWRVTNEKPIISRQRLRLSSNLSSGFHRIVLPSKFRWVKTLTQCWLIAGPTSKTRGNIEPTLGQRLLTLNTCRYNAGPMCETSKPCRASVGLIIEHWTSTQLFNKSFLLKV